MRTNGLNATLYTANTTGNQMAVVGASAASAAGAKPSQGVFGGLMAGSDSTAATITIYDGTAAAGTPKFEVTLAANAPFNGVMPQEIQFNFGMFVVIAGATTPTITLLWL